MNGSLTVNGSARHLVLVGLMATGKSTVGRLLADALVRPLLDSDAQVEARTGREVREIWKTDGEATFRQLETAALEAALDHDQPTIIAAAGGVVLAEVNRNRLGASDVEVIWLRAQPATLVGRIESADATHRPLLDDDPSGTLETMFEHRSPMYLTVADRIVDVDDKTPEQVASEILDEIGRTR